MLGIREKKGGTPAAFEAALTHCRCDYVVRPLRFLSHRIVHRVLFNRRQRRRKIISIHF